MFGKVEEPRQDRQMDFSVCFRRPIQMLSRPGLSSLAVSQLFAVLAARARRGVVRRRFSTMVLPEAVGEIVNHQRKY